MKSIQRFYALKDKAEPRVFFSWEECLEYRAAHGKGVFRVFKSSEEAKKYLGMDRETSLAEGLRNASYAEIADDISSWHVVEARMEFDDGVRRITFIADTGESSTQVLNRESDVKNVLGIVNDAGVLVTIPADYVLFLLGVCERAEFDLESAKADVLKAWIEAEREWKTREREARETAERIAAQAPESKPLTQEQDTPTEAPPSPLDTICGEAEQLAMDLMAGNEAERTAVVYSDGSFDKANGLWGYGTILFDRDNPSDERLFSGKGKKYAEHWQIAGELIGAIKGIQEAINLGYHAVIVRYDYIGVEKWATGEWGANYEMSEGYKNKVHELMQQIKVSFDKVKAHSGEAYNERVDMLAKQALGLAG